MFQTGNEAKDEASSESQVYWFEIYLVNHYTADDDGKKPIKKAKYIKFLV